MKVSSHIIASLSLGTLFWIFTRSLSAGIICALAGVLIDTDHIIEYIIHYGWRDFTFNNMFKVCEQTKKQEGEKRFKKIYLIFHAYEFAVILIAAWFVIKNIYLLAFTVGFTGHLILDSIGNPVRFYTYFMVGRMAKKFDTVKLSDRIPE